MSHDVAGAAPFIGWRRRLARLWPQRSLQSYFVAVILVASLPIAVALVWRVAHDVAAARARVDAELHMGAQGLAQRVDRELRASFDALAALAEAMPERDRARFARMLRARVQLHSAWHSAFLADAQGRVLLDTADGAPVPAELAALARSVQASGAARASGLVGAGREAHLLLAVPVLVDGQVLYVLGVRSGVAFWRDLAGAQAGPAGGFLQLYDGQRRLIADTAQRADAAGRALPEASAAPTGAATPGVQHIALASGAGALFVDRTLGEADWGVGAAAPAAPLEQAERQLLLQTLTTTGAGLLLGVTLALLLSLQVTRPLRALAPTGAEPLDRGLPIREIDVLREALLAARAADRLATEQLQQRASEFETLFRSSPIGLAFSRDPVCRVVQRNPAMDALLGGDSLAPGSVTVLQAGRPIPPGLQPLQRACRDGVDVTAVEMQVQVAGRPPVFVIASAVPLRDGAGRTVGGLSAVMDITALKTTQARLQAALSDLQAQQAMIDLAQDAGQAGFLTFRFRQDALLCTHGMARLLGLAPDALPARLRDWLAAIDPDDRPGVRQGLADAVVHRRLHASFGYRAAQPPDAPRRWISQRVALSYGADGRPLQMVSVATDASEHKEAERLRQREAEREQTARHEAEQASRAKDEFLMMLGHELRNPLGAISAAAEVLDSSAPGDALAQRAIAILLHQTQRLTRLLNELLDMAGAVTDTVELALQPLDLAPLVERSCEAVQLAEGRPGPPVARALAPTWVMADPLRIGQVVAQLLANALRHTPPGTPVSVRLAAEQGQALLQVSDAGPGIAPELLQRIFDLFVQGERTLDRPEGGLGIGLTLVRRLVQLHGGSVQADSGPAGSVFSVRLPLLDAPANAAAGATASAQPLISEVPPGPARRIVLVDDQPDVRHALAAMLATDGHQVTTADDGEAGLQRLLALWPDVAVVDIGLPRLNGLQLARAARREGFAGRLVAISGYGGTRAVQDARRAGFDAYLVKPVTLRQLRAAMDDRREPGLPL